MSTLKDVFGAVKEVLILANKVEDLGKMLHDAALELREHDRRLVRIETMVEMAREKRISPE